jgi:PHD/YefM family antitoxin component YafN of YafNO toxin-antitoxin module
MSMQTMQIEAARKQLGELVDLARLAGEPTLIMRYRKPAAVLVPVSWYEEAAAVLDSAGDGPVPAHDQVEGS